MSFSQGDAWKRLINRYIQAMPLIGGMAEEQIAIRGALVVAINAIKAKVGDAARLSHAVASRVHRLGDVIPIGLGIGTRCRFATGTRGLAFSGTQGVNASTVPRLIPVTSTGMTDWPMGTTDWPIGMTCGARGMRDSGCDGLRESQRFRRSV